MQLVCIQNWAIRLVLQWCDQCIRTMTNCYKFYTKADSHIHFVHNVINDAPILMLILMLDIVIISIIDIHIIHLSNIRHINIDQFVQ